MSTPALLNYEEELRLLLLKKRRKAIRASLTEFSRYCGYEPAPHHRLLISRLEAIARGAIARLAVFMPPGSAKSTYGSVLFPPWFMAQSSGSNILASSHTTDLAEKWGRRIRNLIEDHGPALGIELQHDNAAIGRWALTSGGEYYAAGVGVGIAGYRIDLAVIDDPIRNREDADSKLVREKTWDWYQSDVLPRLKPGGRIILVQTRWHEDDLAGRILAEMAAGGEEWEVVSLPAEAQERDQLGRAPGEMLWDDDYGYGKLLRYHKATQSPRNWSALYQQQPVAEGGNFFKADWLRPYLEPPDPATLSIYGGSDYAVTKDGGDYTVHLVVGVDPEDRIYLLDLWRAQTSADEWIKSWCDLVRKWKPLDWAEEMGQISAGLGPFRDAEAARNKAYCNVELFPTRGDKQVRAQSIRGRMARGGLYVPAHEPWFADFRAELLAFDAGKWDDQVDALGLIGQLLDRMVPGRVPSKPKLKYVPSGYKALDIDQADSFKLY